MSCVLSYLEADRVHLFTDRAFYSQDGKAAFFAGKCFQIHDHPIALAGRGVAPVTFAVMKELLDLTRGSDEMSVPEVLELMREYFARQTAADAEFVIACATKLGGGQHYIVHLHGRSPFPAFELWRPPPQPFTRYSWIHLGPEVAAPPHHYVADVDQVCFATIGLEIMSLMRMKVGSLNDMTEQLFLIGGGVDYTTVDAAGIHTTRLRNWKDELGKHIAPQQERD